MIIHKLVLLGKTWTILTANTRLQRAQNSVSVQQKQT